MALIYWLYYFQNESECFIGVSKHRETNESTRPSAFIVSKCLDTPMKHEARVFSWSLLIEIMNKYFQLE